MSWSLDGIFIFLTGVLFLAIVIAALTSVVSLTRTSLVAFGAAAGVCLSTSVVLAWVDKDQYPPLTWVLILLPLGIIGVLLRDALAARRDAPQAERTSANARPDDSHPLATGVFVPSAAPSTPGEGAAGLPDVADAALASNPWAGGEELARLAVNRPDLRATIAANPATPAAVVAWLATSSDPAIAQAIGNRGRVLSA